VLTRSLITGSSTLFLIIVLYIFGGATLQDFAFAMGIGVLSGAYSSIFIATPVLTHWKEREPAYRARRQRLIDEMGHLPTFPEDNVVARLGDQEAIPAPAATADGPPAAAPEQAVTATAVAERPEPEPEPEPVDVDGGDGASAAEDAEPAPTAEGDGAKAQQREQRRKRQSRRRRKHGRHR
jgi:SecD/SecF fusion protein